MRFDFPELPVGYQGSAWSLSLRQVVSLTEDQATRILETVGETENAHARLTEGINEGGRSFEFFGLIGVHRDPRHSEEPLAHIDVRLALDGSPSKSHDGKDWATLYDAFAAEMPTSAGLLQAYWRIPRRGAAFAVELPIALDDLSGFSEIRGVRLVQREPDSEEELYSLILDEFADERSVQLSTELEYPNDRTALTVGWKRALAIAQLAVEPPISAGGNTDD